MWRFFLRLLFGRRRFVRKLAAPLLKWSKFDVFTLADALEGVFITGATGSGKSTGSGQAILMAYLRAGFGGLVLTAKAGEADLIRAYCKKAGRLRDLKIFSPSRKLRFNPFDYELKRKGAGAGLTENLVSLFAEILEIAERQGGRGGREDEGYWRRALRQLLRNSIDLLIMAKGSLSVSDLYRIVISAPTNLEQVSSDEWMASSFCYECCNVVDEKKKTRAQQRDFSIVTDYFLQEFPALSDRTRSVIVSTFTSMIDVLNRGVLSDLFAGATNITPDAAVDGAIIVIDLPVKEFAEVGQFAQVLWKVAFQRAMERRNLRKNPRPVFLWADEAQFFTTGCDMSFQTTCRAARVATVYLTQNVSNFYAALGGSSLGKVQADSLFANLNTKIFHANGDPVTNDWAASLIGRCRQFLTNSNSTQQSADWFNNCGMQQGPTTSAGVSETIEFEVQPRRFTTLRRGGRANRKQVDGIIFAGGKQFKTTGRTWMPVTFRQ